LYSIFEEEVVVRGKGRGMKVGVEGGSASVGEAVSTNGSVCFSFFFFLICFFFFAIAGCGRLSLVEGVFDCDSETW